MITKTKPNTIEKTLATINLISMFGSFVVNMFTLYMTSKAIYGEIKSSRKKDKLGF